MILFVNTDMNSIYTMLGKYIYLRYKVIDGTPVYMAKINKQYILFANVGQTKVEIARVISNIINDLYISAIIVTGNEASLNPNYAKVGDLAINTSMIEYDVDYTAAGFEKGYIPDLNREIFYSNRKLINYAVKAARINEYDSKYGRVISGDSFISDSYKAEVLGNEFKAQFVDNESAILGELAFIYKIPIISIKGISNYADDNALKIYKENRDILYNELTKYGYTITKPDGAFYLFVKALDSDAVRFSELAKKYELLLVPSDSFGYPGYIRIAYCVSKKQIINSLPAFKKLIEEYKELV